MSRILEVISHECTRVKLSLSYCVRVKSLLARCLFNMICLNANKYLLRCLCILDSGLECLKQISLKFSLFQSKYVHLGKVK